MKTCPKCLVEKTDKEYYKDKTTRDGLRNICITCWSAAAYKNYRLHVTERKQYQLSRRLKNPQLHWARNTIHNHNRLGRTCLFTVEDLLSIIPGDSKCLVCGTTMKWDNSEAARITSPSLDKIDKTLPFCLSNSRVICFWCNIGKHSAMASDYIKHCHAVAKLHPREDIHG